MEDYCLQDLAVTEALLRRLMAHSSWDQLVCGVEQGVEAILIRQQERGVAFDEAGAAALYARVSAEREEVRRQLREVFPPFYLPDGTAPFVPRRDHAKFGYVKDAPLRKVKLVEFNPGSRHHIAMMLKRRHGWQPTEFTETGEPKLDDEVIGALPYPEAKLLARFLLLEKRCGQLAEGEEAWLKHVKTGVIYGRVTSVGTVTGRMSHQKPNLAQVPKVGSPLGEECRALFRARPGWVWVGCDADALELRVMAHFMARYDGGAYIKTVLEGKKSEGTDMHTLNMHALGITNRDTAKTWFYAWLYGGGAEKLGLILTGKHGQAKRGQAAKNAFLRALPALGRLVSLVQTTAKTKGRLRGMDGRVIPCRSPHSAVNALFQSAGAVAMKVALVILDEKLQALGLVPGRDYEFVLNVHDEWQIETKEEHVETIGREAPAAIAAAGEKLGFRCPLAGNSQVGRTWAETH
jgi:DNA polymerase I-like protein with 3'-5' exonuclease and polymerase domains